MDKKEPRWTSELGRRFFVRVDLVDLAKAHVAKEKDDERHDHIPRIHRLEREDHVAGLVSGMDTESENETGENQHRHEPNPRIHPEECVNRETDTDHTNHQIDRRFIFEQRPPIVEHLATLFERAPLRQRIRKTRDAIERRSFEETVERHQRKADHSDSDSRSRRFITRFRRLVVLIVQRTPPKATTTDARDDA